jgi:hypothetical protein
LDVEISEHLVGSPSSKEPDRVRVHMGTEERHGAGCPQGASADVGLKEAKIGGAQSGDGQSQGGGEIFAGYVARLVVVVVGAKGGVRGRIVLTEVAHALSGGGDGADVGIAAAPEANDFAANGVLLICELKGDEVSGIEAVNGHGGCTIPLGADKELDVL